MLQRPIDRFACFLAGLAVTVLLVASLPTPFNGVIYIFLCICLGLFCSDILGWINDGSSDEPGDDFNPSDDDFKIS